jgi:hypothetical protein
MLGPLGRPRSANFLSSVEVLAFESGLWWPLKPRFSYGDEPLNRSGLIEELGTYWKSPIGLFPTHRFPDANTSRLRRSSDVAFRHIEESDEENIYALAQKAVAENLLIVGDTAFARGGHPLYICEPPPTQKPHPRKRIVREWRGTVIASAGQDRSADCSDDDLRLAAGSFASEWVQERLRLGEFFLPHQSEAAAAHSILMGVDMPHVEVLGPPPRLDADEIRLDALFRQARNFINCVPAPGWVYTLSDRQRKKKNALKTRMGLVENASEGDELSRLRYDCLREFSSFIKSEGENFRVRPLFESIGREVAQGLESLSRFAKKTTPLAREDEDALASLAC